MAVRELVSVPGLAARAKLRGVMGDPGARVVDLLRTKRRRFAPTVSGEQNAP
jgi:hypothetical protein